MPDKKDDIFLKLPERTRRAVSQYWQTRLVQREKQKLEECAASKRPVQVKEPHFKVFPEFKGASYLKRYELLCRKLVLERQYTAATFITSSSTSGIRGSYFTPAEDLSIERFAKILVAHLAAFV
jgi:hypothetical protein